MSKSEAKSLQLRAVAGVAAYVAGILLLPKAAKKPVPTSKHAAHEGMAEAESSLKNCTPSSAPPRPGKSRAHTVKGEANKTSTPL